MPALDVGAGIAAIGSVGTNQHGAKVKGWLGQSHVWSWIIFWLCIAWLLGMFAMFGGYKGDVAS